MNDTTGTPLEYDLATLTPLPSAVPLQPRPIIAVSAPKPPNLTSAQIELLSLLAEECGEVVQAIGKILRHGYMSVHPNDIYFNRTNLEYELGDVLAAIQLLETDGEISGAVVENAKRSKLLSVQKYLHHQTE